LRIFTAALVTETNTFSPIPTGMTAFKRVQQGSPDFATMARWREQATRDGHIVMEGIAAFAQPGGRTVRAVYESLRDELLQQLARAMPVDVVLLFLHGAMAAEGYDDCDGDLLQRCRELAGSDAVVGAELDLHANLSDAMVSAASIVVAYREYPHTDIVARGVELYESCMRAARGELQPVSAVYDCRMVGIFPTSREPLRSLVDDARAAERDGIASITLIHGFPWGDVADAGAKVLAIADRDRSAAERTAEYFGKRFWEIRDRAALQPVGIDRGLDRALSARAFPVVVADMSDNAGGGAPGDATFILRRILERNITNVASGTYYDPVAVGLCFEAGEGATIDLRIGGKLGPTSGDPLDLRAHVRGTLEAHSQTSMDDTGREPLGACAWIEAEGIDIVLASVRSQVFAPDAFTGLGIPLRERRIVVVKSSHHFWAKFSAIAAETVHVAGPGALRMDLEHIPYEVRSPLYWPRVADPFAREGATGGA
jgi:microcystin degradation protein MlrC